MRQNDKFTLALSRSAVKQNIENRVDSSTSASSTIVNIGISFAEYSDVIRNSCTVTLLKKTELRQNPVM